MNEEQLIPIKTEEKDIKPLINLPELKNKTEETNKNNQKIINSLPSWSIEPPIEIKRGNN